jgi:hypothetical protein
VRRFCNDFDFIFSLNVGGRIFVIGIYLGLITSLVTTFFAINTYMDESAILSEDSQFFDHSLVTWQRTQVHRSYTTSYITMCLVAAFAMYICV